MTTLASDDFNRPDASNLGPNWTFAPGFIYRLKIATNGVTTSQTTFDRHGDYYSIITWPNDQWAEAKMTNWPTQEGGPMVRCATSGSQMNFYGGTGWTDECLIYKYVNNTRTQIAQTASQVFALNDIKRLEAQGTTIRLLRNGTLVLSVTDSSLTQGSAGLFVTQNTPITEVIYDDWQGGNFSVSTSKAVVGAPYTLMGVRDPVSGLIYSKVQFNLLITEIDGSHWTTIEVSITESDSQTSIRSKMLVAAQAEALNTFGLTLANEDVLITNYYIGLNT